jgi:hypothetical protein
MSRKHQTPAVAATLLGEMFIVCPGRNQDAHSSQILASTPSPHPGGGAFLFIPSIPPSRVILAIGKHLITLGNNLVVE